MKRGSNNDLTIRKRALRHLKWSAVIVPTLFIWWSETVRHAFFDDTPVWLGNLITATIAFLGSMLFAHLLFRLIEYIDAALVTRNRRLATLYALASAGNRPGDEGTLLGASMPVIRDVLGATDVMLADEEPHPKDGLHTCLLAHGGATLGWLVIRGVADAPDATLLAAIGENLSVAIANRRLTVERRRIAVLEERDRIARELHDGLAQVLASITLQSERAHASLADGNTQAVRVAVDRIEQASGAAYADVREAIVGLRTDAATDFLDALQQTADWFEDATGIAVIVDAAPGSHTIPPLAELQFLRVVQESLTNVRKHARASHVWITLASDTDRALQLTVRDDGIGFDPDRVPRLGRQHFGLLIMRERVESFGGTLAITAAPGAGTTIRATLPDAAEARGAA